MKTTLAILLFYLPFELFAQTAISIEYSPVCAGLVAQIETQIETTDSVLSIKWDLNQDKLFEEGEGSSIQNIWEVGGVYKIAVQVKTTTAEIEQYRDIEVYPSPDTSIHIGNFCGTDSIELVYPDRRLNPDKYALLNWQVNGRNLTGIEPTYHYTVPGRYNITLEATTKKGCFRRVDKRINIGKKLKADFEIEDHCWYDTSQFVNTSIGMDEETSVLWRFGDDNTSTEKNPKHYFSLWGNQTVSLNNTLIVKKIEGCSDTMTKILTINDSPNINITCDCRQNERICYVNKAKPWITYYWFFEFSGSHIGDTIRDAGIPSRATENLEVFAVVEYSKCESSYYDEVCTRRWFGNVQDFEKNPIEIFPNPASMRLRIRSKERVERLTLLNALGQVVLQSSNTELVDVSGLSNGVYTAALEAGNRIYYKELIIHH